MAESKYPPRQVVVQPFRVGFGFDAVLLSLLLSLAVHYLLGAFRIATSGPKVTISARPGGGSE